MKIFLQEPAAIESLDAARLQIGQVVGLHGFNGPERAIWEESVQASWKAYQALRSIGVKKKYAATLLPLATVYRRGNGRPKRPVQADTIRVWRLKSPDDTFEKGLGI